MRKDRVEKIPSKRQIADVGSRAMAGQSIKTTVEDGLFRRAKDEADRRGVSMAGLLKYSLIVALESPRRLSDLIELHRRLDEIESRLRGLEGGGGERKR